MSTQAPGIGSKPSPTTPEASAALAEQKAHAEELTLARWHQMARDAGVLEIRIQGGKGTPILISLEGRDKKGRKVSSDMVCPMDHPIALYAVLAVHEFREGLEGIDAPIPSTQSIFDSPPLRVSEAPIDRLAESIQRPLDPMKATGEELDRLAESVGVEREPAAHGNAPIQATPVSTDVSVTPRPKARGDGWPICIECKVQPAHSMHAEYCGGGCARKASMRNVEKRLKGG